MNHEKHSLSIYLLVAKRGPYSTVIERNNANGKYMTADCFDSGLFIADYQTSRTII